MELRENLNSVLNKVAYKRGYKPPTSDTIFKIDGVNVGSIGNFVVYSGLPKAGKTHFTSAALASIFNNNENTDTGIFRHKITTTRNVGWFDTESNESDFYNNISRIEFMANNTLPDFVNAYQLREFEPEYNRQLIEFYISENAPEICFIDGMLDLIVNYNDEKESRAVIQWLKFITKKYNVLIVGVIHLGKKENHTLGHFGSMIDRYAQTVMEVTRNLEHNIYTLKPKYMRSAKNKYFNDIHIQWTGFDYVETLPPPDEPQKKRR